MKTRNWICLSPVIIVAMVLVLTPGCKKDEEPADRITDGDGNVYSSVTIDTLIWLVENLKTTKYIDGTSIPLVSDNEEWKALTTHGYCWYNNEIANKETYGALYNFYVVFPQLNGNKNICPAGWHVPDFFEWKALEAKYGPNEVGGLLKEAGTAHWTSPNTGATNGSGFTGLPGGNRNGYSGTFSGIGTMCSWWSSSGDTYYKDAFCFGLSNNSSFLNIYSMTTWKNGSYIRCVKKK